MPNELPATTPRRFWLALSEPLHALHLYGAAGIAAFGWAVSELLGWDATPYLGLWFCAALLIYNADRVRPDPADRVNIPQRTAASVRWRTASLVVLACASMFLVGWPVWRRDWLTLALVLGGGFVCLGYSFPLFGRRLKEVPLFKTLFAPTIVTAAVVVLPWIYQGRAASGWALAGTVARAWSFLFFNMLLCDWRDLEGDRRTGVVSVPVWLGEAGTRWLLVGLLAIIEALALALLATALPQRVAAWRLLCLGGPLYLGALLLALRRPRSESFYEWWVEGMLYLPAFAVVLGEERLFGLAGWWD